MYIVVIYSQSCTPEEIGQILLNMHLKGQKNALHYIHNDAQFTGYSTCDGHCTIITKWCTLLYYTHKAVHFTKYWQYTAPVTVYL